MAFSRLSSAPEVASPRRRDGRRHHDAATAKINGASGLRIDPQTFHQVVEMD
jgi:hypothetical protein